MLLENFQIDPAELPALEEVEYKPLHRDYMGVRILVRVFFFLFLAAVLTLVYLSGNAGFKSLFFPWLGLFVLSVVYEILVFRTRGYALRQRDITYRSGLLVHSMITVPYNRIQHSEVNRSFLERIFDLASVEVYTAGGSSSDLSVKGLRPGEANRIREFITRKVNEDA